MQNTIPELKMLLSRVESRFGRIVATSTDFDALSDSIEQTTSQMLSASTLKRLWGYVTSNPVPRVTTLDILAQYIGMRDFREFCNNITANPEFQSSFFSTKIVRADSLEIGRQLNLRWNPNRILTLEYLGTQKFRVIGNVNSHIEIGDEFEASTFMLGYPLFITSIWRNGEHLPSYIAGSRNGLTGIEIL